MSTKSEIEAILNNEIARLEALVCRVQSIPYLGCLTLTDQGDSGKEIFRLLGQLLEIHRDSELQTMDIHAGYGNQPGPNNLQRADYWTKRVEDVLDLTEKPRAQIDEYVHGRAA
ncbi:Hypothetical protein BIBO1_0910 [Brucella inopinata BO1]|uniref:hypothetical protein n=1 Tax=Brucella phage BiPBO1 TaxID=1718278 RepID=UPI0001E16440|nr:hypothetical protein [Brucella inopinata]YP_009304088.1 hypothetical protein BJD47_gp60 [Brucella phage BiPBO1]ALJ98274.1 hypothetical protein BiPBO1_60 [Brucella phage BiPBO1]EFM57053.1 Hypothetical protein BIBO1_0910 [Brucella inopinata BO1]KEY03808.1 hypothetical protein IL59_0214390 [Brucella suis bv. 4 str. 40]